MHLLAASVAFIMINLTIAPPSYAAAPPLEPGVSLQLAQWRAQQYRDIRYALRIQLLAGADLLRGSLEITVTAPRKPVDLVLDWRGAPVRELRVNGVPASAQSSSEHLVIGRKDLKAGRNTVQLTF